MDEKSTPPPARLRSPSLGRRSGRRRRLAAVALFATAAAAWYLVPRGSLASLSFPSSPGILSTPWALQQKQVAQHEQAALGSIPLEANGRVATKGASKVQLEAHIMSKCPDARDCLRQLVVPAMERAAPLVNLTLGFIGDADSDDTSRLGCMHGPGECLGNMLMLCAADMYPGRAVISLGFANCLADRYEHIPERALVEDCAMEHAVDFDGLNACVSDGGRGEDLLRRSMQWSHSLGVTKSCTVRLEGRTWCVRDGGEWSECPGGSGVDGLVREIERVAREKAE